MNIHQRVKGSGWLTGGILFFSFVAFSNLMIEEACGADAQAEEGKQHALCAADASDESSSGKADTVAADKGGLSEDEWLEVVKLLQAPQPAEAAQRGASVSSLQAQDDRELLLNLLPALPTRALMASLSILPHLPEEGRGGVSVTAARHMPSVSRMRVEALER